MHRGEEVRSLPPPPWPGTGTGSFNKTSMGPKGVRDQEVSARAFVGVLLGWVSLNRSLIRDAQVLFIGTHHVSHPWMYTIFHTLFMS